MSDDEERIATLVRERDEAREECGHAKAMKASQRDELMNHVRLLMDARAVITAVRALADTWRSNGCAYGDILQAVLDGDVAWLAVAEPSGESV